jgi:hypothetical protein
MNTGQMLLTICALVLLGTTVLTLNRNTLNEGTILRQTESGIYAVSLATSYIQKALSLDFDEGTVTRPASVATNLDPATATFTTTSNFSTTDFLTLAANLGIETNASGRNIYPLPSNTIQEIAQKDSTFDDFDDYNNFSIDTSIVNVDRFRISAKVYYVTQPTTAQPTPTFTTTPTWLKRIDIAVNSSISRTVAVGQSANDSGTDTIRISYIKSFY